MISFPKRQQHPFDKVWGDFFLSLMRRGDLSGDVSVTDAGVVTVTKYALTKTDDSNVTLSLGGTPSEALLRAASITVGWSGTLAPSRGGNGVVNNDAATLTRSGDHALTITTTGTTGVTFPTSGTLAIVDGNIGNATAESLTINSAVVGEWTTPAFSASDFTGNGSMTWTVASGDVTSHAYTIINKTMTVAVALTNTTIAGVPNSSLQIAIPAGKTAAKTMRGFAYALDNGTRTSANSIVNVGGSVIQVQRTDAANWTASADNTQLFVNITFEIN